jgi:hypothetical protein
MNRTNLAILLLVAIMGSLLVFQSAQSIDSNSSFRNSQVSIQLTVNREGAQVVDASYRLAHHCRMVVVESLIIAKQSINLVLDIAIDSL